MTNQPRCAWPLSNPTMVLYHDREWGVPLHQDREHFEYILLDAFQAGLSWATILNRRDGFRKAFANFDPKAVARFSAKDEALLLKDPGIIRNRLKVKAAVNNAKAFLIIQKEFGSFDQFVWRFVNGKPIQHRFKSLKDIPARSPESDALSQELIQRGMRFVGSTICYAYMQAAGLVNDHLIHCFRHKAVLHQSR